MIKFVVIYLLATLTIVNTATPTPLPCLGCAHALDDEKLLIAETRLNNSLLKLAEGEGPIYKLAQINSGTSAVVTGVLYKINADLIDENEKTKTCDIELLYFRDVKITFICPGEEKVTIRHKR